MRQVLRAASVILLLLPFVVTGSDLLADLLLPQHWLQTGLILLCTATLLRSLLQNQVSQASALSCC